MGSVKDLIIDDSKAGILYIAPELIKFGRGAWGVSGKFSVGDLKKQIPEIEIKDKAETLTMTTARFFEHLKETNPEIETCFLGILDKDGNVTDTEKLLDRGDLSNIIVMKLAHTPETYCNKDLNVYKRDIASGKLKCYVTDIESIFRLGFPLGSSTFEKIFAAVGMGKEYETLATYSETVKSLDKIRSMVREKGLSNFPKLEKILQQYGLKNIIPNPGFVLREPVFDSTTKFEESGDRALTKEEEKSYSGLSEECYRIWTEKIFPKFAQAQIKFCDDRNILNIDGKAECVSFKGMPIVTDFACTVDENRLMIIENVDGENWAIPSNKEIQRAIFRQEGIYAAISEAKRKAEGDGNINKWRSYIPKILNDRRIDLIAVTEHSCNLMGYAIAEVANRILEERVFDAKPVDSWVKDFVPYASKIERQK